MSPEFPREIPKVGKKVRVARRRDDGTISDCAEGVVIGRTLWNFHDGIAYRLQLSVKCPEPCFTAANGWHYTDVDTTIGTSKVVPLEVSVIK